jgi:hypothetical protein
MLYPRINVWHTMDLLCVVFMTTRSVTRACVEQPIDGTGIRANKGSEQQIFCSCLVRSTILQARRSNSSTKRIKSELPDTGSQEGRENMLCDATPDDFTKSPVSHGPT